MDLSTWNGAQGFIAGSLKLFRLNFERDGYLVPVAFLWVTKNIETGEEFSEPQLSIVALDLDDKDYTFTQLKLLAVDGAAMMSLFATESWKVEASKEDAEEVLQYIRRWGSLKEHPNRKEMVIVTVEHRPSNMTQAWEATIERAEGVAVLGDFTTEGATRLGMAEGRAVNILPIDPKTAS